MHLHVLCPEAKDPFRVAWFNLCYFDKLIYFSFLMNGLEKFHRVVNLKRFDLCGKYNSTLSY